jgi:hypothetical protein
MDPGGYKEMSFILADRKSALVYEPKCGGRGVAAGSQPMSTAVHNAHGAQVNFRDLTPFLTWLDRSEIRVLVVNSSPKETDLPWTSIYCRYFTIFL